MLVLGGCGRCRLVSGLMLCCMVVLCIREVVIRGFLFLCVSRMEKGLFLVMVLKKFLKNV